MLQRINQRSFNLWLVKACCLCAGMLAAAGCSPEATFSLNSVYLRRSEREQDEPYSKDQIENVGDILVGTFGTPDDPFFPQQSVKYTPERSDGSGGEVTFESSSLVSLSLLRMAAGPVGSDEDGNPRGLYREHCVHCHGITGNGAGPTGSFLNPYPRDFRKGDFKFKSTPGGHRPTHADLKKTLVNGISGTAMPSFRLLSEPELESLVHYVRYLGIRGEVERSLMDRMYEELEPGEKLLDFNQQGDPASTYAENLAAIREIVEDKLKRWNQPEFVVTEVPERPQQLRRDSPSYDPEKVQEAIVAGKALFYGKLDCIKCHGYSAIGDGGEKLYDSWTTEWYTAKGPWDQPLVDEYMARGAHEPREVRPRNLRQGVFRGGRRPVDLYWRVRNGINGSGMPAQPAEKITDEEIWQVITYVQSLPFEPISRPEHTRENKKEVR